jgi:hypothetical protein
VRRRLGKTRFKFSNNTRQIKSFAGSHESCTHTYTRTNQSRTHKHKLVVSHRDNTPITRQISPLVYLVFLRFLLFLRFSFVFPFPNSTNFVQPLALEVTAHARVRLQTRHKSIKLSTKIVANLLESNCHILSAFLCFDVRHKGVVPKASIRRC